MRAVLCPPNVLVDSIKNPLNLLVEFGAVGDDEHTPIRDGFEDGFCKPYHCKTLTAALRVPDDTTFSTFHVFLRGFDPKELVVSANLLGSSIEDDEVVQDVKQSGFVADLTEFSEQEIIACVGMCIYFLSS